MRPTPDAVMGIIARMLDGSEPRYRNADGYVKWAVIERDIRALWPKEPGNEVAWLIEDTRPLPDGLPRYFCGAGWTDDHVKAVRFTRRQDAEAAIIALPHGWHLTGKAVEHMWVGA